MEKDKVTQESEEQKKAKQDEEKQKLASPRTHSESDSPMGRLIDGPAQPSRTQWIPPTTGNPDLDPAGIGPRPDLRSNNPLIPRGMIMDPKDLIDQRFGKRAEPDASYPPGARFDPYRPPDPSMVGPGRGPKPERGPTGFKGPNPDHFPPPGPSGPFI